MDFPDTSWTVLAEATLNGGEKEQEALERLCREYWQPVAVCIKARGAPSERVDDLTQDFFLQLMENSFFRKADPQKGRFRSFILGSLRFFLADDAKRHAAQKKGGHMERAQLTEGSVVTESEDAHFDRAWAEVIFERVFDRVRKEVINNRGVSAWDQLRKFLPGSGESLSYRELGSSLGITEGGAKTEVFRLRQRFREALREEVGRTVSAPHEIDEELAHLRAALEQGSHIV